MIVTHRSLVLQRSTGGCSAQQRFIKKLPSLRSFLVQKRMSAGIQLSGACENPLVPASTKPFSFWSSLHHPCSTASSRASVISASSSASSSMSVPQDGKGDEEEDLWQFPDRASWYAPRFAASDQPDWNPARFVRSVQLGPNMREVTVEIEISRERVPLRNAYKHIGQRAAVRVNGGAAQYAYPTVPPFPMSVLREGLLKVRNDLSANEVKQSTEAGSALAELSLLVTKEESPALYNCSEEDALECGPFQGYGLDLKGGIAAVFLCPTIVIFCEGQGIATARALMAATTDVGGLSFKLRTDVRMYYRAPNAASFCFGDELETWEERFGVKVITSTRDTFQDMFDDDDTLMYEPNATAAIILTGQEEDEAEMAALEVCRETEISMIIRQSVDQEAPQYL